MPHHLNRIFALAEEGDLEGLKTYLAQTVSRIPDLNMSFCENLAADIARSFLNQCLWEEAEMSILIII